MTPLHPLAITKFETSQKFVDLVVTVAFRLIPLKVVAQKVLFQIYFDSRPLQEKQLNISNVFAKKDVSVQAILDLENVRSGPHTVKVVLHRTYPVTGANEIDSREETFSYDSKTMIVVDEALPIVRSMGQISPVEVVDESAREFYEGIEKRRRKEMMQRRDGG